MDGGTLFSFLLTVSESMCAAFVVDVLTLLSVNYTQANKGG